MSANIGDDVRLPLQGVRVLEFGHVASGPYATSLLADLGADVVKVEPPSGDQMRSWPPLVDDGTQSFSHNFASVNRNKRSIAADLKNRDDREAVQRLCQRTDVIVENYRPGVLDRFGLGFDDVAAGHRGLVYCSISGFGLRSPYKTAGAYDVVIQAMSGLMAITGEPGGNPVKVGVPVADFITGLYAALTVTALLPNTRNNGRTVLVDCPMLDCMLGASALQTSEYWGSGDEPAPRGSAHPRNSPYQAYRASDRDFVVAAGSQRLWTLVCEATDLRGLLHDPRFTDQQHRAANQDVLTDLLQDRFRHHPAAYWIRELGGRGVPVSLVNTYGDILNDPHIEATHLVQAVDVPIAGSTPMVVFPARIGDRPSTRYAAPPLLGEHTKQVLSEWGTR